MDKAFWKFLFGQWRKAVKNGQYPPVRMQPKHERVLRALRIALTP